MATIGLDLARKGTHHAVVLEGPNHTLHSRTVRSQTEDLERFPREVKERRSEDGPIQVVMEASGLAWLIPAQFFLHKGCRVFRIQAEKARDFRRYLRKHVKTDRIDAEALARLWYLDPERLDEVHLRDQRRFALKQTIKQREDFLEETIRFKNRLIDLLDGFIPGLSGWSSQLVNKKRFRPVLEKLIDCRWVRQLGFHRFQRYVQRRDSTWSSNVLHQIYEACLDALELHDETVVDFAVLKQQGQQYLQMLTFCEDTVYKLTQRIASQYRTSPHADVLESIPGVGTLTGAYADAYLGPIERFPNMKKVDCWSGFIPATSSSGQTQKKGLKMSKAGPAPFRRQLYLAASVARRYDPQLAACYHREMVEKGNPHTKAVVACARRLLHRMVRVMRTSEPYELRDTKNRAIGKDQARKIIQEKWRVPDTVRGRLKQKKAS